MTASDSRGIGPTRETTLRHMFLHDRDEVGVVKDYAALMRICYLGEAGRASCSDASNYIADRRLRGVSRSGDVKLFLRDDKLF